MLVVRFGCSWPGTEDPTTAPLKVLHRAPTAIDSTRPPPPSQASAVPLKVTASRAPSAGVVLGVDVASSACGSLFRVALLLLLLALVHFPRLISLLCITQPINRFPDVRAFWQHSLSILLRPRPSHSFSIQRRAYSAILPCGSPRRRPHASSPQRRRSTFPPSCILLDRQPLLESHPALIDIDDNRDLESPSNHSLQYLAS